VKNTPKAQLEKYLAMVTVLDATHYVGQTAPAPILFQFARHDPFISDRAALEYYRAASEPKVVKWYNTGHELNDMQALRDRDEWLQEKVGLGPVLPLLMEKLNAEGEGGLRPENRSLSSLLSHSSPVCSVAKTQDQ
jgi:hypothetical protein